MKGLKIPVNEQELNTRIALNYNRLSTGDYYSIIDIFSPKHYDWCGCISKPATNSI